ncbi:hypothetical protein [Chryseobacterium rhizosphaerae]|uniref:hypothetical protein n=1 Tax=Chryseobacterium rhizosphaerae TaxID=395937 RepID=UPI002370D229|nr:hypothetical protein [Chryseobacterium rhizosphaerae]
MRRFLNADENIQDPTNTQIYNKYGYAVNNPLMYNDPSGEVLPFLVGIGIGWFAATVLSGAIIGAAISMGIYILQATINNNFSWGGFAKSILLGAATGAVSAGLGEVFSATGFLNTVANGALTGAGTGGVTALITGQNFLEGVWKGAVIGGAVAAVSYTVSYAVKYRGMGDEAKYYDGNGSNIGNSEKVEYSEKSLKQMRSENFSSEEVRTFKVGKDILGSEKYSQSPDGFFQLGNGKAYAYTTRPNFFSGVSDIHYAKAAFASKGLLFTTMVHETGHAYIMNAGNLFIKQYDQVKLFNRGYTTPINDLGHAAIWDLENHLKSLNNFNFSGVGYNHDIIMNAVNNNISGDNTVGFNILKKFLLPVFNRKLGFKPTF